MQHPAPRQRARRILSASAVLACAMAVVLAAAPDARAQGASFPAFPGMAGASARAGLSTGGKTETPTIGVGGQSGGRVGGEAGGQAGGTSDSEWAASAWAAALGTAHASLAAAGAFWPALMSASTAPGAPAPIAPPADDFGPSFAIPTTRLPPRTRLGGCLGMQMGIADHEPRPVLCAVLRVQPLPHWSFGLDGTYSFGSDDGRSPAFGEAPPAPFRHEIGAWPNAAFHFVSDDRASFYLRLGGTGLVAPMLGEGWQETRSYAGGHLGMGFDVYAPRSPGFGLEVVGFMVARLDGSLRPDAPAGSASSTRGGGGAQLRFTLAYDFIGQRGAAQARANARPAL